MKTNTWLCLLLLLAAFSCVLQAIELPTNNLIPISVSVTGDVKNPGVYTLTTLNRVSDAVSLADQQLMENINPQAQSLLGTDILSKAKSTQEADTVEVEIFQQRNIILIRQGSRQSLDLLRFYRTGDISQNPFLKDGDVLLIKPVFDTVTLEGSVVKNGEYEFRPGDTLKDLLELALGFTAKADLKQVKLYRYKDDLSTFEVSTIDLSGYARNPEVAAAEMLHPSDRIVVSENSEFRKAFKITVTGKVKNPGIFFVNEKTSLYDLLLMCGGPTPEADLSSAFLYNQLKSESFDPDFERLKLQGMLEMTWVEYSYLRTKIRQLKGKYAVDIAATWNSQGKEASHILRDGDELVVPETFNAIWVTGQVKHPGIVDFKDGMTWKEYIQIAGGYTNNRKFQGARIIRAYSGNWIKPTDKIVLRPGDTIFIPEKEEVTTWDEIKDVILFASQVLTVILTLKTLKAF